MRTYRTAGAAAVALALLLIMLALCLAAALRARTLLALALGGEQADAQEEFVNAFSLRAEMVSGQMQSKIRGWQSIAPGEQVAVRARGGELAGVVYPAVQGGEGVAWALVFGGQDEALDVACMLSLGGYRVLLAELTPEGELDSLGLAEAENVELWVRYVLAADPDADIVIFGQDSGAAAALIAASRGLGDAVTAVAVDSAYSSVRTMAQARLTSALPEASGLDMRLLALGYRAVFGESMDAGDIAAQIAQIGVPVLLIHGTGDDIAPAWMSEDMAAACGGELLLIEGAGHGMARFVDHQKYEQALLAFYRQARES